VTALTGLALIVIGAVLAGPLWYRLAVRDERAIRRHLEKVHRAEMAVVVDKANDALTRIADEVAMAYAPADFEAWAEELRQRP
jgi:hypothetical protein